MTKNGKSTPKKCQITGTVQQAVDQLLEMLETLKIHIFRSTWHRNIFEFIRKNVQTGYVVQIFDFTMNFCNIYQDEVQSAYWDSSQMSIHCIINYFLCPIENCSELVSLNLVQITDDLKQDSFLACAAHNIAVKYLAEIGIPMDMIIQFCNNCSSQYKSRRPFAEIARYARHIICVFLVKKMARVIVMASLGI